MNKVLDIGPFSKRLVLKLCGPRLRNRLRRSYLTWQVSRGGGSKEPESRCLEQLLRPGDAVADLGANVGLYTVLFSSLVGSGGIVCSCEPILDNFLILQSVVRKAKMTNVRLFRAALGAHSGSREMIIPRSDEFAFAGYYQAHFSDGEERGQTERVDVLTLDQLWTETAVDHLDFVKCDVEGAELEIFNGGLSVIKAQLPGWLLEVSRPTSDAVFRAFNELGYRAFVYDGGLLPTEGYRDGEFSNYFFLHPSSKIGQRATVK